MFRYDLLFYPRGKGWEIKNFYELAIECILFNSNFCDLKHTASSRSKLIAHLLGELTKIACIFNRNSIHFVTWLKLHAKCLNENV